VWCLALCSSSWLHFFTQISVPALPWAASITVHVPSLRLTAIDDASNGPSLRAELALKLVLNALSTGGHVLKGKVFELWYLGQHISSYMCVGQG
jgi:hypothetical protein